MNQYEKKYHFYHLDYLFPVQNQLLHFHIFNKILIVYFLHKKAYTIVHNILAQVGVERIFKYTLLVF